MTECPNAPPGDLDDDDTVTSCDALELLTILKFHETPTLGEFCAGDIDGNSKLEVVYSVGS